MRWFPKAMMLVVLASTAVLAANRVVMNGVEIDPRLLAMIADTLDRKHQITESGHRGPEILLKTHLEDESSGLDTWQTLRVAGRAKNIETNGTQVGVWEVYTIVSEIDSAVLAKYPTLFKDALSKSDELVISNFCTKTIGGRTFLCISAKIPTGVPAKQFWLACTHVLLAGSHMEQKLSKIDQF